jgi:hypothetical protein
MKTLISLLAVIALAPLAAIAQEDIMGTWNVVSRPADLNTCGKPADPSAYQWLLTENAGKVTVTVQGETAFKKLSGTYLNGELVLDGPAKSGMFSDISANAVLVLQVRDGSFTGVRYALSAKNIPGGQTLCLVAFTLTGKKQ